MQGANEINVHTDAKGLKDIYEGDWGKIENSQLQGMMEKFMPYNLNFIYVPGKEKINRPSVCHLSRRVQEKLFDSLAPDVDHITNRTKTMKN